MYYGDYVKGAVVFIPFNTAGAAGGSITIATNGTPKAYINGGTTEVTAGVTLVEDHDGITGRHGISINTAGASFTVGADVDVALDASTIDGQTINAWVGKFSIDRQSSVATQVWNALTSALTTVGSIGRLLVDNINATISSRLASASYIVAPSAATTASAVRTELAAELGRIDASVSTRLPAGTVAADVTAIKAKTDSLTFTVAGNVDANMQRINDVVLTGNGASQPFDVV